MSADTECSKSPAGSDCRLFGDQWSGVDDWVSWVITGFAPLPEGSNITIQGRVDTPSLNNTVTKFWVLSYSSINECDVFNEGRLNGFSGLEVSSEQSEQAEPLIVNDRLTFIELEPLRAAYCGDLRLMLESPQNIPRGENIEIVLSA